MAARSRPCRFQALAPRLFAFDEGDAGEGAIQCLAFEVFQGRVAKPITIGVSLAILSQPSNS